MKLHRLVSLVVLVLSSTALAAQQRSPAQGAIAPLAFLLGHWEGEAWIDMGPGGRHQARQQEWVSTAAGGGVLTVIGQGVEKLPDGTERLIHDAFALIYADRSGKPAIRTFRAGQYLDPDFTMTPTGFVWSFEDPRAGKIRYTMTRTQDNGWNEIGERSADGTTWVKFFEMNLKRMKD